MPKPTTDPQDFKLKFIDGTPVPADYAEWLNTFTRAIQDCDVTAETFGEDDELTMGAYWLPGWRPNRDQE